MDIKEYDLPDAALLEDNRSTYRFMIWEPQFLCIVLGQSNQLEQSVFIDRVLKDKVPVYKRPSGGETVVLSPRMLVVSILKRGDGLRSPGQYFNNYNNRIIRALQGLGIKNLSTKGISDICIDNQKILGSSIYRNKDRTFYHGVLNTSESINVIEHYLKHPRREPDYRRSRRHKDFVTSLTQVDYHFPGEMLRQALGQALSDSNISKKLDIYRPGAAVLNAMVY